MSRAGVIGRILSLLIALAYVIYVLIRILPHATNAAQTTLVCLEMAAFIAIPVALIWFPEQIGAATGFIGHSTINAETPPILVSIAGWIILLALPILAHHIHLFS